ncbi:acyltransferase family protein [Thauera humireducens]|uniref:acyltransferase family protein n=1 Tax=Thauera humireducens TaxID=1134435 RepID=UPI00311D5AB9
MQLRTDATSYRPATHFAYRPDIDGLRAVAILSVISFHFFPEALPGGFIGVDVFFVISGFLISSILFRALDGGRLDFMNFYAHRARRIFPSLIVVLLGTFAWGWLALLPADFGQLGKHIAAGAAFVQNIVLLTETGYFDTASESKPLLHLWSLAIEEQFYLLYPVVLWATWRLRLSRAGTIALLCASSFGLMIAWISSKPEATFFLPFTRFWELLVGALLALLVERGFLDAGQRVGTQRMPEILSASGLLLIGTGLVLIHKGLAFPGWWSLLPTLGAALVILAGPQARLNKTILGHPWMVAIGLISYPLYLWHWPIVSFIRMAAQDTPSIALRSAGLALSVALAYLTYRFVEHPIRFGKHARARTLALCLVLAAIGALGLDTHMRDGRPDRYPEQVRMLLQPDDYDTWFAGVRTGRCHLQTADAHARDPDCIEDTRPLVMLWGDSHAASLYPGLHHLQSGRDFGIAQFYTGRLRLRPRVAGPASQEELQCAQPRGTRRSASPAARHSYPARRLDAPALAARHPDPRGEAATDTRDGDERPAAHTSRGRRPGATMARLREQAPLRTMAAGPTTSLSCAVHAVRSAYRTRRLRACARSRRACGGRPLHFRRAPLCTREGCMTRTAPDISAPAMYVDFGHLTADGARVLLNALHDTLFEGVAPVPAQPD